MLPPLGRGDPQARGRQALEQRLGHGFANAQHLAGGLHFRPQDAVGVAELFKAEHRHLDGGVGRRAVQARAEAQVNELFAQHDPAGQVHHGNLGHLADVRDGPGSPGINLDHVQLVIVNQVLDVYQAPRAQGQRQLLAAIADLAQEHVVQVIGRVYGNAVAAVHARPFNVLHDARD